MFSNNVLDTGQKVFLKDYASSASHLGAVKVILQGKLYSTVCNVVYSLFINKLKSIVLSEI